MSFKNSQIEIFEEKKYPLPNLDMVKDFSGIFKWRLSEGAPLILGYVRAPAFLEFPTNRFFIIALRMPYVVM